MRPGCFHSPTAGHGEGPSRGVKDIENKGSGSGLGRVREKETEGGRDGQNQVREEGRKDFL